MQLAPPRGMRDFYPEEARIRNWIFSVWRDVALRCGFEEYDSSVLEQEEMYIVKSGPEITGQLFNFEDKGGRRVSLRPEMTPTLARMIAAKGSALPKPIKWFTIAQCFRYERMARGRKREHYQWNLDIVGVREVTAEAELIAAALSSLECVGLTEADIVVRISHRGLLGSVLKGFGVPAEAWPEVFGVIDKRGKEQDDNLWKQLVKIGISDDILGKLFSLLDQQRIDRFGAFLDNMGLSAKPLEDLKTLFSLLQDYGCQDCCEFTPSIVRGLPYYTGIVFECFDRKGTFRAIFGGGRYDNLLQNFSSESQPAAGLGFGDVVIRELLEQTHKLPSFPSSLDYFLIPFSDQERPQAVSVLQKIRRQGMAADILLTRKKLKGALRDASRIQARGVILFLPDELKEGILVMRNLQTGMEDRIKTDQFLQDPTRYTKP
jgi:histidyl-tRNA synthetase